MTVTRESRPSMLTLQNSLEVLQRYAAGKKVPVKDVEIAEANMWDVRYSDLFEGYDPREQFVHGMEATRVMRYVNDHPPRPRPQED